MAIAGSPEAEDNTLTGSDLATGAVSGNIVLDSSITGTDIANGTITAADLLGGDSNGSISLSAGGIPNGGCADLAVGVPGADVGQAVVFSLRGAVAAGMLFYGVRVPTAGQVTLKVCNFTGASSPAVSSLPVRILTFG
jgi:hypothetical protein